MLCNHSSTSVVYICRYLIYVGIPPSRIILLELLVGLYNYSVGENWGSSHIAIAIAITQA